MYDEIIQNKVVYKLCELNILPRIVLVMLTLNKYKLNQQSVILKNIWIQL